ncbi:hypothetical protein O1D97_16910 [Marinomonas sp. 15G1-11]|uniref:Uncharacterized protein n=1 Tax=Marinomonas phaeophyticola TaxID=3004091 RepID=A0ABT4JYU0_9GAMM|nr:hypothetical protein [Marinomonas sp. 15G1-11]MCZ2723242.1 hypothetical protein [Marinomonas sp. 15G1-11]
MQKINHKAVFLTICLLFVLGGLWSLAAPKILIEDKSEDPIFVALFSVSVICYVYFNAWLLVKTRFVSFIDGVFLIIGIWLFSVMPNLFFIQAVLALPIDKFVYLLTFGALAGVVTAFVLSLWRSSRTIFKG